MNSCVLCAVTDCVSLSSCWSHDAKFAGELTLVQLKFSSINTANLTSYSWIRFSVLDIFICRTSLPVHPPIWPRIRIVPSSLVIGISPNYLALYFASFSSIACTSWLMTSLLRLPSVLLSYHSLTRPFISASFSFLFSAELTVCSSIS